MDARHELFMCLDDMPAEIKNQLESNATYLRFLAEQEKLHRLASSAWARTGKLNSPGILKQESIVTRLGMDVLEEIEALRFILENQNHRI